MIVDEAIKYLKQLYPNGGHCWLDEQRLEAIDMAVKALQGEPVCVKNKLNALSDGKQHLGWIDDAMALEIGEELAKEVEDYIDVNGFDGLDSIEEVKSVACHFANWQKEKVSSIIKQYADKGEKNYQESVAESIGAAYQQDVYWDGFRDCANGLLRELKDN